MSEYIERAAVVGKMTSGEVQKKLREMDGDQVYSYVLSLLNSEPAADVMEVPPELQKTVELLRKEYEKAKQLSFVRNPLAYALYQVWKAADRGDTE